MQNEVKQNEAIQSDRPFPFLKLPPELRNHIYKLALRFEHIPFIKSKLAKDKRRRVAYQDEQPLDVKGQGNNTSKINFKLLMTNKQICQ